MNNSDSSKCQSVYCKILKIQSFMDQFFSFLSRNKSVFSFKNRSRTGKTYDFSSPGCKGVEALMKQDESQGCFKAQLCSPALWPLSGEGGCSEERPIEIKSQTRTILETINTLYSISNNPHFQNKNSAECYVTPALCLHIKNSLKVSTHMLARSIR